MDFGPLRNSLTAARVAPALLFALAACGGGGGAQSSLPSATGAPNPGAGGSTAPTRTAHPSGSPSSTPAPGSSASPRGSATPSPAETATPPPTPTPSPNAAIPSHIATWAYDDYFGEGANATSAQVQSYVTYAEGGSGDGKSLNDCNSTPKSCYSVWYSDPNFIYDSSVCPDTEDVPFIAASSESWYVHYTGYTDSAHRVQGTRSVTCSAGTTTQTIYVANDADAGVQAYFLSYLQGNADAWDYYWMDNTSAEVLTQMYGPGGGFCPGEYNDWCTSTQELPTNASVVAEHASFANAMSHTNGTPMQFFFNGVNFVNNNGFANDFNLFSASSHFVGAICENCIVNDGAFRLGMYPFVLNAMAQVDAISGAQLVELNTGDASPGSSAQISERLVTTAVAWLGYSNGHTVVFPNLEYNTANLAVWPEEGIYPTQPIQSMSTSAQDIEVAGDVWRREFRACYYRSVAIGPCAAILNGNSGAVTAESSWLEQAYGHQVELVGGDALSGGSLELSSVTFSGNSTVIPSGEAVLLVK
jgi:hypothetical protein